MMSCWCLVILLFHICVFGTCQEPGSRTSSPAPNDLLLPDGSVRLTGGYHPYTGRAEIYYGGVWGTICNTAWNNRAANVLCYQLGHEAPASDQPPAAYLTDAPEPIHISGINCAGFEDTLADCPHDVWGKTGSCDHSQDVGVACTPYGEPNVPPPTPVTDGSLRLRDGTVSQNGRVEIYYQGEWGTVCHNSTDTLTADVICRQLGYLSAHKPEVLPQKGFAPGTGPIHLSNIECDGTESKLLFCSHARWGTLGCGHERDMMVSCRSFAIPEDGAIRLVDGDEPRSGRVEIAYQGMWGTVCDTDWNILDVMVVCNQLGYGQASAAFPSSYFGRTSAPILLDTIECQGTELRLEDCVHRWRSGNCKDDDEVGVACRPGVDKTSPIENEDGRIRLVGGLYQHSGRLEVKYRGDWGTVCDSGWNLDAASVVCRQLGYPSADTALPGAFFGQGTGPVLLDHVSCEGQESRLALCSHDKWYASDCEHAHDASVVCTAANPDDAVPDGTSRLAGGGSLLDGYLQIYYQGVWGTVCSDNWKAINSDVACRQLGFAAANPTLTPFYTRENGPSSTDSGPIVLDEVACSGPESRLVDCDHDGWGVTDCEHGADVGIVCVEETSTTIQQNPIGTTEGVTTNNDITATDTEETGTADYNVIQNTTNTTHGNQLKTKPPTSNQDGFLEVIDASKVIYVVIVLIVILALVLLTILAVLLYRRFCARSYKPVQVQIPLD